MSDFREVLEMLSLRKMEVGHLHATFHQAEGSETCLELQFNISAIFCFLAIIIELTSPRLVVAMTQCMVRVVRRMRAPSKAKQR